MTHQTIYYSDPFSKKFFFSTDFYQEFEGEDKFVPISMEVTLSKTRKRLQRGGFTEIPNPDPEFAPKELE